MKLQPFYQARPGSQFADGSILSPPVILNGVCIQTYLVVWERIPGGLFLFSYHTLGFPRPLLNALSLLQRPELPFQPGAMTVSRLVSTRLLEFWTLYSLLKMNSSRRGTSLRRANHL